MWFMNTNKDFNKFVHVNFSLSNVKWLLQLKQQRTVLFTEIHLFISFTNIQTKNVQKVSWSQQNILQRNSEISPNKYCKLNGGWTLQQYKNAVCI